MQEVFIDHQASHITLQMQNLSSLSPRAGVVNRICSLMAWVTFSGQHQWKAAL